jgi:hypothetical protein
MSYLEPPRRRRRMRPGQPFEFSWLVASDHHWIKAKKIDRHLHSQAETKTYLVPVASERVLRYKPLESATGLFRDFAGLELKESAFRQFANTYGLLTGEEMISIPTGTAKFPIRSIIRGEDDTGCSEIVPQAEPEELWFQEITDMRRWLRLWDALQSESPQQNLRPFIRWDEAGVLVRFDDYDAWIANKHNPELLSELQHGDLIRPALYQLQRVVNEKLDLYPSSLQLLWEHGQLLYFVRPKNLLAALWLQFSLAIDGNRQYRICRGCDRWFEVGGGRKRTDAATCSPTCRKRKHRRDGEQQVQRKRSRRHKRAGKLS